MNGSEDLSRRRENLSSIKQALLEQRLRGLNPAEPVSSGVAPRPAHVPGRLSFAQERMWFAAQLNPESPAYNMHEAYRLRGPLDLDALTRSLNSIIERHEVLRTRFVSADQQTAPMVAEWLEVTIPVVDLEGLSKSEQDERLEALAAAQAQHLFRLDELPLLRLSLARLGPQEHVLFLTLHHIVSDEWSIKLLWSELEAGYMARLRGRQTDQPPLNLQYDDFAHWQRERLQSGALEDQMDYWRKRLEAPLPRLQLPTDHPRPPVQRYQGAIASIDLAADTRNGLQRLNQRMGTTPFMTFLALYAALLYRYSGQEDLLIGAPIANRSQPEFEDLIGVCLNTLVLRLDLSGDPTFIDLLQRVRTAALEAFANSDLPFEKLVEELKPARDLSYHPLFQVMFVYQSQPSHLRLPDLQVESYPVDGGVSKFDLTLFAGEGENGPEIFLEYNTDLFTGATARRMLAHFRNLAQAAIADPDAPVSRLPMLTSEERRQLLVDWNDTKADPPAANSIHAMIEDWARKTPGAPALLFQGQRLSYVELDRRANRLTHALHRAGVGPNSTVALCAERSFELFVGLLGILKAGGAYLPLDPDYPLERREFMLQDSGAQVVVTQPQFTRLFDDERRHVIGLDLDAEQLSWSPDTPLPAVTNPQDLAYIIYTSGSTGQPKGVPVTHAQLLHSTTARLHYYPEKIERFLLLSSFAFDSSMAGIFGTLCAGGTLVLPAQRQEQEIGVLAELIARYGVTQMLCLPSLYSLLLEFANPNQLASLQAVIVAGEACPVSLVKRHYALLPETNLYNEYGPTEGTVWCSVYRVPAELPTHIVPIGRPIENTQLYVLDHHLEPVPTGVSGDLYLAGAGVVSGYHNRPDLNADRFVTHTWDEVGQVRLYRTGDLARWLPDGNLEFLGRRDHQVKIRGYRIELEEIEALLNEQPEVNQVAVVARPAERSSDPGRESDPAVLTASLLKLEEQAARRILEEVESLDAEQAAWLLSSTGDLDTGEKLEERDDA